MLDGVLFIGDETPIENYLNGTATDCRHTLHDFGLILKSRQGISAPKAKTITIDIPGTNGVIDLTDFFGDVKYENRDIKLEFHVIGKPETWAETYSAIMDWLQGRRFKIIFDDDTAYYYVGRFHVDEWASNMKTSVISISGTVDPYKYELISSIDAWLWDNFNFESSVIREWKNITVNAEKEILLVGSRRKSVPIIKTTVPMTAVYTRANGDVKTIALSAGDNITPDIVIDNGVNRLRVTPTGAGGKITVEYRGGRL